MTPTNTLVLLYSYIGYLNSSNGLYIIMSSGAVHFTGIFPPDVM